MDKLISKVQFSVNEEKGKVVAYVCDCKNFLAESKNIKKFKHLGFDFTIQDKFVGQATLNPDGGDQFNEGIGKSLAMLRLLRAVNRAVVKKLAEFDSFVKNRTIELNKAALLTTKISKTHARNFNYALVQEEHIIDTNFF